MTINEMVNLVHETAKTKGWYDEKVKKKPAEAHMLMVSEIAEATEECRNGRPPLYEMGHHQIEGEYIIAPGTPEYKGDGTRKPEGELIELADCVIRIMDYCGYKGWDLENAIRMKHAYNQTRPSMHGGKLF